MPSKTTPAARKPAPSSPVKNAYLLAYNAASAALWAGVLYKTITIGAQEVSAAQKAGSFFGRSDLKGLDAVGTALGNGRVFGELDEYTRLVQSLAGLEVLHSLVGRWSPSARDLGSWMNCGADGSC